MLFRSPFSVYDKSAFKVDLSGIRGKYPILGICYGAQFLSLNKAIDEMDWNDLRACARQGNAVACLCVQKRGGIPAIPKKREVMEFLNQHIKK